MLIKMQGNAREAVLEVDWYVLERCTVWARDGVPGIDIIDAVDPPLTMCGQPVVNLVEWGRGEACGEVITDGAIYIMNDKGDTVERVRPVPEGSRWEVKEGRVVRSYRYCQICGKTWKKPPAGMSCGGDVVMCASCGEECKHLGCQNWPNCDMEGCGPDDITGLLKKLPKVTTT